MCRWVTHLPLASVPGLVGDALLFDVPYDSVGQSSGHGNGVDAFGETA